MPAGPGLCPDRPGLFPGQWVFTQRTHSSVTRRKCIFVTIGKRGKPRFCGAGMAPRVPLALAANKSESEPSPRFPGMRLGGFIAPPGVLNSDCGENSGTQTARKFRKIQNLFMRTFEYSCVPLVALHLACHAHSYLARYLWGM